MNRQSAENAYYRAFFLDFVMFVPGLFHLKMAATDAFWHTHTQLQERRKDPTGFMEYIHHHETGKFTSTPGIHCLHDSIHHATWVDVLDCWHLEALSLGHHSLKMFIAAQPSWELISKMSEIMVQKYLPGCNFSDIREGDDANQDIWFENMAIQKQHGLLYLELSHSMNHSDVGHILWLFPYWIALFKSTGKHKYTAHMIGFLTDLDNVYPPKLRYAVIVSHHDIVC